MIVPERADGRVPPVTWCLAWVRRDGGAQVLAPSAQEETGGGAWRAAFDLRDNGLRGILLDQSAWRAPAALVLLPQNALEIFAALYVCDAAALAAALEGREVAEAFVAAPETLDAGLRKFCEVNSARVCLWRALESPDRFAGSDFAGEPGKMLHLGALSDLDNAAMPEARFRLHVDYETETATRIASVRLLEVLGVYVRRLPTAPPRSTDNILYAEDIDTMHPRSMLSNHALDYLGNLVQQSHAARVVVNGRAGGRVFLAQSIFMQLMMAPHTEREVPLLKRRGFVPYEDIVATMAPKLELRRNYFRDSKTGVSRILNYDYLIFPVLHPGHWFALLLDHPFSASATQPIAIALDSAINYLPQATVRLYVAVILAALHHHLEECTDSDRAGRAVQRARGFHRAVVHQQNTPTTCGHFVDASIAQLLTIPGAAAETCEGAVRGELVLPLITPEYVDARATAIHADMFRHRADICADI